MIKKTVVCANDGCDRSVSCSGLCAPCYQSDLRWRKKSPAARREREKQVGLFLTRLGNFRVPLKLVPEKPKKVVRRRKAA